MASDYGIRSGLVSKGYSNDDIGYDQNSGYVTVKGQNFLKPDLNLAGTTYTNQQSFDNAYNQFQKQQQAAQQPMQTQTIQPTQQPAQSTTTQYKNPYTDQYTQMISQIQQQLMQPQQVDPYSTPQFRAAEAQAQQRAQQGIRAAQEALGSSGFGRSTALGNTAQREQNDATQYLMTQVVPNIVNQLQNERQQQLQNQFNLLNPVMSLLGREDNLAQRQLENERTASQMVRDNARADAALTGQYLPPGAQDVINRILGLKQQTESGRLDPQSARIEADRYRNQLALMGVDPNVVGYDADYTQALQNVAQGFPTYQARIDQRNFDSKQEQDRIANERNQRADNLTETQVMAQLTGMLPDGTPTNARQQQELTNLWQVADATGVIPPQLAQLYGLPENTPTLQAKQIASQIAISQQNANTSARQADISAQNANTSAARLDFDKDQSKKKAAEPVKIDAKTSADTFDTIIDDLGSDELQSAAKRLGVSTKEAARILAEDNKNELSDSDYKKLRDYINENF